MASLHLTYNGLHPSNDDWAQVLMEFPLFADVSRRQLRKLVRAASFAEVARGDTVIFKGDNSDSLYVILGGTAKAVRKQAALELGVGDYFGELALFDGAPRSATVVATSDLHVMKLPAHSVRRLAAKDPAITLTILKSLSTKLRRLEAQVAES